MVRGRMSATDSSDNSETDSTEEDPEMKPFPPESIKP